MHSGTLNQSSYSPYTHEKFMEIVRNFRPVIHQADSGEVIEAHRPFFSYMESLPGTICFIFDFAHFRYLLISKSIRNILGIHEDEFLEAGISRFLEYLHPDDKSNIIHIHKAMFGYIHNRLAEEIPKLRFDFNFRMKNRQSGQYIQFLQQTVITALSEDKQPLYDFSTCTDITVQKKNNRMELNIYRKNDDHVYELVYNHTVPATIGFGLSAGEFRVLKLSAEVMTSKQIAFLCSRSMHTINNQKRNVLIKTGSASLAEAMQKVGL